MGISYERICNFSFYREIRFLFGLQKRIGSENGSYLVDFE